ncbi:uncharacterized protein LOC144747145 [Ciona intestinalis]
MEDKIWRTGEWPKEWTISELVTLPKHYLDPEIAEEQFGFTSGKGTTDAILVVRNIIQKVAKKDDENQAKGVVRVNDQHTEEFSFLKGVRQGCLISPLLFNTVGERIMREVEERLTKRSGKVIGGRLIWNIRYADDTTMVAKSREECGVMGEA